MNSLFVIPGRREAPHVIPVEREARGPESITAVVVMDPGSRSLRSLGRNDVGDAVL